VAPGRGILYVLLTPFIECPLTEGVLPYKTKQGRNILNHIARSKISAKYPKYNVAAAGIKKTPLGKRHYVRVLFIMANDDFMGLELWSSDSSMDTLDGMSMYAGPKHVSMGKFRQKASVIPILDTIAGKNVSTNESLGIALSIVQLVTGVIMGTSSI